MATLTVRMPDDTHERLRHLAKARKVSLNKLISAKAGADKGRREASLTCCSLFKRNKPVIIRPSVGTESPPGPL